MFSMAMWMAALVAPLQIVAGDLHGLNTLAYQPAKIAAMEGHWETRRGQPLILFGWPDTAAETTRYAVEVPKLGSYILTHDWDGEVKGLKAWPAAERPSSPILFWSFRIMVGVGVLMVLLGLWSLALRLRGRLYDSSMLLRLAVLMGPSGFVAVLAGWITTEVGRQPYTVYGLLRTAQSVSPIALPGVASSLFAFIVVYFAVFGAGILYILRLMAHPPQIDEPDIEPGAPVRAAGITPAPSLAATPRAGG
jgi:cytochrome d ubiquinol oxidase subunit I